MASGPAGHVGTDKGPDGKVKHVALIKAEQLCVDLDTSGVAQLLSRLDWLARGLNPSYREELGS